MCASFEARFSLRQLVDLFTAAGAAGPGGGPG